MLRPCYLTQKQADMFRKYCNSSATSLHDVYKTWSADKEEAFKACLSDMKRNARQETIDVLNELKGNIKSAIDTYFNKDGGGYYLAEDVINDIDELIKELIKNAEDKS